MNSHSVEVSLQIPIIIIIIIIIIKAFYHYSRPDGNSPIPPDAKLTYELHLLAARDGPNVANMTDEERLILGYVSHVLQDKIYQGFLDES